MASMHCSTSVLYSAPMFYWHNGRMVTDQESQSHHRTVESFSHQTLARPQTVVVQLETDSELMDVVQRMVVEEDGAVVPVLR